MLAGALPSVARSALIDGDSALSRFILEPFQPVQAMLADTATDVGEALSRLGEAVWRRLDDDPDDPWDRDDELVPVDLIDCVVGPAGAEAPASTDCRRPSHDQIRSA